jgi:cell division transport system permease protein
MALGSLGALMRAPVGSLMTVAVIGIALALPSGLIVILGNLQQLTSHWDGPATLSLFLLPEVTDDQARSLGERIAEQHGLEQTRLITRQAAMEEFRSYSGFGAALDVLEDNPLPAVIVARPPRGRSDAAALAALTDELQRLPEVDSAQLDLQWVQRLQGITEILQRGVWLVAALLTLAVLLIVGNTIRLEIQHRDQEIAITKLVGATDGFVRRPFLYQGAWLGLLGGIGAWLLVAAAIALLAPAVTRVADLYHSGFRLLGPGPAGIMGLLAGGGLIGWLGAWLSVGRHIRAIEP